jgi:hypothetical protein
MYCTYVVAGGKCILVVPPVPGNLDCDLFADRCADGPCALFDVQNILFTEIRSANSSRYLYSR